MTPEEKRRANKRITLLSNNIKTQFQTEKDKRAGDLAGLIREISAGLGTQEMIEAQLEVGEENVFVKALDADADEIFDDANQYLADIQTEIEDEWRTTTGLELTTAEKNIVADRIASQTFGTAIDFELGIPSELSIPSYGVGLPGDLSFLVNTKISDGETQILRFPTHYTTDKQIGEIARQLDKAGIIDTKDRDSGSAVLEAIKNNLSTFKRQIDEVTSETNKNFSNAIDTLIENANPALPPTTPEQFKKVGAYQWINQLSNPGVQNFPPNMLQAIAQEQYSQQVTQEPEMQKQIEGYTKNFQDLIKTLNPIFSNDPAASYKQNILNDMLKSTVAKMEMVKFDPELDSQQKLEALNQLQVTFDKGSEDGSVPGIAEAFKRAETQYGIDRATQTRDNANRNPEQFQQNYLQASPSERKILDEDLNILNQQGYSITPSGKFVEQADPLNLRPFANLDFDPSTIKDPTARVAMEMMMAYTQGMTPEQQFNMQLGLNPPALPSNLVDQFELIGNPRASKYTPLLASSFDGSPNMATTPEMQMEGGYENLSPNNINLAPDPRTKPLDTRALGLGLGVSGAPNMQKQKTQEEFNLMPNQEFDELRGM